MSFELAISTPNRPANLRSAWEEAFRAQGLQVEIYPKFSPETWRGGFLPFRVLAAPADLIGFALKQPALAGFEISFGPESAHLRTASGRSTTEFALQCVGGATLAILCSGHYVDDQNGIVCDGPDALEAALSEIRAFVKSAKEKEKVAHAFPGWEKLG